VFNLTCEEQLAQCHAQLANFESQLAQCIEQLRVADIDKKTLQNNLAKCQAENAECKTMLERARNEIVRLKEIMEITARDINAGIINPPAM
jgi:chromosome segregation ATPase